MRETRLAGVFLAALGAAALAAGLVGDRTTDLPRFLDLPLVFLMAGIASALAAAWTANLLAGTDTRTQLLPCLAFTEGLTLLTALALLSVGPLLPWTASTQRWIGLGVVAVAATGGAASYRIRRRGAMVADAVTTIVLLGLIPLVVAGVVWAGPRVTGFFAEGGTIDLSDEQEAWCADHRRRVFEVARAMGSEDLPDPDDEEEVLEWRSRQPRRYFAACQTAYLEAH